MSCQVNLIYKMILFRQYSGENNGRYCLGVNLIENQHAELPLSKNLYTLLFELLLKIIQGH